MTIQSLNLRSSLVGFGRNLRRKEKKKKKKQKKKTKKKEKEKEKKEKEKEKEKIGMNLLKSPFFNDRKNRLHDEEIKLSNKRYGSYGDSSHPHDT